MSDPWFGPSPYDAYPAPVFSLQFPSLFDTYRGGWPTAAELERERDYQTLDRMHRYRLERCVMNPISITAMHRHQPWSSGTHSRM